MEALKYTIIKSNEQYKKYCNILEELINDESETHIDEIELLEILVGKWDDDHNNFNDSDPVEILKALMDENNLKAKDLTKITGLSKGSISKILNYHKGFSKETIRHLAAYFKVSQESFNRPYRLVNEVNRHFRDANLMKTPKNMAEL